MTTADEVFIGAAPARRRVRLAPALRRPGPLIGLGITAFWILMALGAWKLLGVDDPQAVTGVPLEGPSAAHPLGTDDLGRDVLARMLAGAASVLTIAPAATAIAVAAGTALGLAAGYRRGWTDEVLMRGADVLLSFPVVITAVLALALLGRAEVNVIAVIAILFTPLVGRTVRTSVLVERERDYVTAARLRGESAWWVCGREILPNVTGPIAVEATLRLGYAVFTATTLAFLGLGVRQPSPDWGLTIALQRGVIEVAPLTVLAPALALASLVVAVNLIADALQQETA